MKNIFVMSGKGGVGKTTVAVNLAWALSEKGFDVGLLDIDIHGPNVPKMLGLEDRKLEGAEKIIPIQINKIKVMSMAFLMEKQDAVIWRGPMKHNAIKQFIEDVEWGELDYLVIDLPPGTGDEHITVSQLIKDKKGAIVVSAPQQVAIDDVRKAIDFCKKASIPIIGLIENMSGSLFGEGSVEDFALSSNVNFLGKIKLEKYISEAGDIGKPFVANRPGEFDIIVGKVVDFYENTS